MTCEQNRSANAQHAQLKKLKEGYIWADALVAPLLISGVGINLVTGLLMLVLDWNTGGLPRAVLLSMAATGVMLFSTGAILAIACEKNSGSGD